MFFLQDRTREYDYIREQLLNTAITITGTPVEFQ